MFNPEIQQALEALEAKNETAAVAVIVRREAPTSGKPGDKAVITADGNVTGWIGGGCTKGIVIKEALEAIQQLSPRLVRIIPGQDQPQQEGVKTYTMTCMSGGTVEVYIEPLMPVTRIKIFGRSHIAKALCEIGKAAGYHVEVISDLAEADMFPQADWLSTLKDYKVQPTPNEFVVVCTQGEDDARSLLAAIQSEPHYLAFVASPKKAQGIFTEMRLQHGITFDQLESIKSPAGLDLNAKTPQEVAISILAEIVQNKREVSEEETSNEAETRDLGDEYYINPVCNIPVQKSTAKHVLEYAGEKVYFCCDGCKVSFEAAPEKYVSEAHA